MKRMIPPLLLGLALALSACAPNSPVPTATATPVPTVSATPSPAPTETATLSPTPVAAPVWGIQSDSYVQTAADHPDVTLVEGRFDLPYIENATGIVAYTAVNNWYAQLLKDLKSDLQAAVAQAQDDYETALALGDPFSGSSHEADYELMYQTEDTVSILRTHYGHSSGPYPTLIYLADRFDLTTGAYLRFADFFNDSDEAEHLALTEIIRQGAEHPEYDQNSIASAFSRENFYPTTEGFVFFYQPQTLNPQAATKPEFLVPYSLLEGLLSR